MSNSTEGQMMSWLLEHPEFVIIIPMLALCYMLWFLVARHFPFLLTREDARWKEFLAREDERNEQSAEREEKRSTEMAGAVKEMTGVIQGLDRTLQVAVLGKPAKKRRESGAPTRRKEPASTEQ